MSGRRSCGFPIAAALATAIVILTLAMAVTAPRSRVLAQASAYGQGWNIVAGPDGAHLIGATDPIYTLQPGDAAYQSLP
ncbi:MAG: hypothetical protein ACYDCQ_05070, partial [Dehalococcoidia bacterium]